MKEVIHYRAEYYPPSYGGDIKTKCGALAQRANSTDLLTRTTCEECKKHMAKGGKS